MGSTSVNTKTRFLYQAFYTKTRFLISVEVYLWNHKKILQSILTVKRG
jgi:hypothetical protein